MDHIDTIASGVGFVLCSGMTYLCGYAYYKGVQTERWLKRSAQIIESKIFIQKDAERISSYSPKKKYEYLFNEVKYVGSEIYYKSSPIYPTKEEAQNFIARYLVGATVEIRINPKDVSKSVLIPGALPKIKVLIIGGLIGMFVMSAIFFGAK